ncbi:MAG: alpha-xylosidase, partial [Tepidisphaeraceae bacterium]
MKFRDGAWLWRDGVHPACLKRVTEWRIDGDALIVCGVDRGEEHAVDRFEGVVLQLRVTSPMPNVIRVQAHHHAPAQRGITSFDLDYGLRSTQVRIEEQGDDVVFTSGALSLRFRTRGGWDMRFEDGPSLVTRGAGESLGYMTMAGEVAFMMQRLSMSVGECIYGMGERFGPLVKNGQSVAIWNEDGGTCSDQAYKNVPFYLSSRGYGLLVNSPGKVEFEVGTERVSRVQMSVPGESLDYYLFYGPDPKVVLDHYTRLSGRPALPPAWSLGLWLSTSFTTKYDEATVNAFVDGMAERHIPLSVFHFDCFWMKERHWCDFEWDREAFPNPRASIERLKAKGLKVCLWINPYVSQLSALFDEGREHGCFIKRADGSVYQRDQWQPGVAIVDFTNPRATEWYTAKLRALLEMGVDAFKTDFGERIPAEGVVYHDGSDPALVHNRYAYLYNKAVFELLEDFHGKGSAIVFARAATAGCQRFPAHWGGDCDATFEAMAENLRGGLSFCLSGAAFWSHDIGGFSGDGNAALYKRWVAFGLLSTHSRLHGSANYRVPWLVDDEAVVVLRQFTRLKNRLFPYLFAAAHEAREHGWPVMRAMMLEFPHDLNCHHLDRQYMLGASLLVAPVFRADDVAEYYLPRGRWTHLQTGKVVDGGDWQRETVDFLHVPAFVRENTVLPTSADEERPQWRLADPLTLNVFQLADGADVT